jgi:hypothetical protein
VNIVDCAAIYVFIANGALVCVFIVNANDGASIDKVGGGNNSTPQRLQAASL